jgi:hypothetical protein
MMLQVTFARDTNNLPPVAHISKLRSIRYHNRPQHTGHLAQFLKHPSHTQVHGHRGEAHTPHDARCADPTPVMIGLMHSVRVARSPSSINDLGGNDRYSGRKL